MSLLLFDTQLLLWAVMRPRRLPPAARGMIEGDPARLCFSVVSIWEVAIKASLKRADFSVNVRKLRLGYLSNGFRELDITGDHAIAVGRLPWLHRDPFDRLLLAQATVEGATLVTTDPVLARYPGAIELL